VGHFLAALLGKLTADEVKAWLPWMAERLTRLAVAKLPEDMRARYDEEWRSHLDQVPGEIAKVWAAFGFSRAARKTGASLQASWFSRLSAFAMLLISSPTFLIAAVFFAIYLKTWNVFIRYKIVRGEREIWLSRFHLVTHWPIEQVLHNSLRKSLRPDEDGCALRTEFHYSIWRRSARDSFDDFLECSSFIHLPTLIDAVRGTISVTEFLFITENQPFWWLYFLSKTKKR
jgi:hypothetical protein